MSGIFGAWNFDGQSLDPLVLARMGEALAHRGPDGERLFVSGAAGLGCRLFHVTPESASEEQPFVRPTGVGVVAVVFDGRLDNRADLVAWLRAHHDVSDRTPDVELLAAAYDTAGLDFAEHLEGDFAAAVLDHNARRLVLARDALGVRPLYYSRTGSTVAFASEIKSLLTHPHVQPRVNERVLAGYMVNRLHGQPEDGTTFFEDIYTVPPAHVTLITPDTCVSRRYWDFSTQGIDLIRTSDEAVSGFRHYFNQSVRRRLRSAHPVAVTVSGGLDSTSIFCTALAAVRGGVVPAPAVLGFTVTPGDGSPADEITFVEAIEKMTGAAIARIPLGRGVLDQCEASAWHTEMPSLDMQWNTTRRVMTNVAQSGARTLLTGHWGDQVLFDQSYLVDLARSGAWRELRAHMHEYLRWHEEATAADFRSLFIADLAKHQLAPAVRRLLGRIRRHISRMTRRRRAPGGWYDERFLSSAVPREFGGQEPKTDTAHTRSLYREVRSRYNVHCLEWNNKAAAMFNLDMAFPFLDRDLVAFLMRVPGAIANRGGVPKALLRQALRGTVPDVILGRASKANFTGVVNQGFAQDFSEVERRLQSQALSVALGYVDKGRLAAALADARLALDGNTVIGSGHIADLLGLELWLGAFIADRQHSVKEPPE